MGGRTHGEIELMNKYEVVIPLSQQEGKLSVFLSRALPLLPERVMREAFKNKDVKQDGVRVPQDALLEPGARVEVFTPYEAALPVVYEDKHILVINKPSGLSADEDYRGGMTVLSVLSTQAGDSYTPRLCHRLDNQTSGLMVLAKDDETEKCLLEAFKQRTVDKRYICIVRGALRPEKATKEAYIVKDAKRARVRVVSHNTPEAKPIKTQYAVLKKDRDTSRVVVDLLTGRTHQIRAHMAFLAAPIVGDDLYGDRPFNKRMKASRLMLCAVEMTFHTHGVLEYLNGKTISIDAPF